ncbi:MAG: rhomboid family intramembrane serine protease [Saprospiraceae bacterium]
MLRVTEVVKNLIIINVIVFVAVAFMIPIPDFEQYFLLYPLSSPNFVPVQVVTHMFMHAGFSHLLFNMLGLFFLGPLVESSLGPKRFLILYLACGFVASIAQLSISSIPILGASGAVYGVLAAFATMFPNMELMLLFPPIPIKAKYLGIGLIAIGIFSGITGAQAGIAHFAHVGGAILGFLMIRYWKMENLR